MDRPYAKQPLLSPFRPELTVCTDTVCHTSHRSLWPDTVSRNTVVCALHAVLLYYRMFGQTDALDFRFLFRCQGQFFTLA